MHPDTAKVAYFAFSGWLQPIDKLLGIQGYLQYSYRERCQLLWWYEIKWVGVENRSWWRKSWFRGIREGRNKLLVWEEIK